MFRALRLLILLLAGLATAANAQKRIALTYDDVPREPGAFFAVEVRQKMLIDSLKRAGVAQAAIFVTTEHFEEPYGRNGAARIAAYTDAGHVIANHSYAHEPLSSMSVRAYLADIDLAQSWLAGRAGLRPWFRFPYMDEGNASRAKHRAVMQGLVARGLTNGYVTVDAHDWTIDDLVTEANRKGQRIDFAAVEKLWTGHIVAAADFYDALARRVLGRSPVHNLLLHETDLAAMYTPALVAALKADGWTIVTADEAFADPLAGEQPHTPPFIGSRIAMLAADRGIPLSERDFPHNNDAWLRRMFETTQGRR